MTNSTLRVRIVIGATALVLGVALLFLIWSALRVPNACLSNTLATIALFNARLEVVYTNCDTIGKDESIRVYISSVAQEGKRGQKSDAEIIFDYDPNGNQLPPTIEGVGDHRVLISVGDVGTVFVQRRRWRDVSVDYKIGHVAYPSASRVDR